jgi:hypothetical protein
VARSSLRLDDFSDRELLFVVDDAADDEGWASTADVAEALNLASEHPKMNAGIRLGYLRRLGVLERHPDTKLWRLTTLGEHVRGGRLDPAVLAALEGLSDEQVLVATTTLAKHLVAAGPESATLMRREWTHGMAQRRFAWAR